MIGIEPNTCMTTETLTSAVNFDQDVLLDACIEVNEITTDLSVNLLSRTLVHLEFNKSIDFELCRELVNHFLKVKKPVRHRLKNKLQSLSRMIVNIQ